MSANCRTCQFYNLTRDLGVCHCKSSEYFAKLKGHSSHCNCWRLWEPPQADTRVRVRDLKMGEEFTRAGDSDFWIRGQMYGTQKPTVIRRRDGLVVDIWGDELVEPVE